MLQEKIQKVLPFRKVYSLEYIPHQILKWNPDFLSLLSANLCKTLCKKNVQFSLRAVHRQDDNLLLLSFSSLSLVTEVDLKFPTSN